MSTAITIGFILLGLLFVAICVILYESADIEIYNVGRSVEFSGGTKNINRIRIKGHKFAYAGVHGPDGLWEAGDLLIYSPKFEGFTRDRYYLFRKYEHWKATPFYPTTIILRCKDGGRGKERPKFEQQLGCNWECIGELRGIRVNGINIIF